jgi:response regulator of citrate/malate metabolism
LVDDAVLITKRIAEMIGEINCVSDIFIANDFLSGLNMVKDVNPDLVLLDIHLPDKSGIDLLEIIKKDHESIKVIMVTNKVSPYYKELCIDKGAHHFIDKSKEFEMIPSIIETYC